MKGSALHNSRKEITMKSIRNDITNARGAQYATLLLLGLVFVTLGHAQSDAVRKLDCRLQYLAGQWDATLVRSDAGLEQAYSKADNTVRVQVRLNQAVDPAVLKRLENAGLNVDASFAGLVTGSIDPDRLLELAQLNLVSTVAPVTKAHTRAIEGEGVGALKVDRVFRNHPELTGEGIKVGILSDSFGFISEATPVVEDIDQDGIDEITGTDSQLAGELPEFIEVLKDFDGADEGRAMAEIVHEMAPGAQLAFYTAFDGISDFASGIVALAEAGCQVIVDDVGYIDQPVFQDGEVSQAVTYVAEQYDVVYLTATGNDGNVSISGAYRDIDPYFNEGPTAKIPRGYDLHTWDAVFDPFDPFLSCTLMPGDSLNVVLAWENSFSGLLGSGATTDYDLYLLDAPYFTPDALVGVSDNYQGMPDNPQGDPIEWISVYNSGDEPVDLYIAVNKHHGPDVNFKLHFPFSSNFPTIPSRIRSRDSHVLYGHPLAEAALAVAAVNYYEVITDGMAQNDPHQIDPEFFSSQGGNATIYFSPTGEPYQVPVKRFKPDIASVDGTNNSFFVFDAEFDEDDSPNFFGTSAAAPHAAGIVALMRQADPTLSAADIRRIAKQVATDIASPGVDSQTGHGLLYGDIAVEAALDPPPPETNIRNWAIER